MPLMRRIVIGSQSSLPDSKACSPEGTSISTVKAVVLSAVCERAGQQYLSIAWMEMERTQLAIEPTDHIQLPVGGRSSDTVTFSLVTTAGSGGENGMKAT